MPSPKERAERYVAEGRFDELRLLRGSLIVANRDPVSMYNRYDELIRYCDENLPKEPEQPPVSATTEKPKRKKKGPPRRQRMPPGKKGGTPKKN